MPRSCGSRKEAPWRLFSLAIPFAAAMPVAWLLPNHYYPWLSAWQEGAALALLFAAALLCRARAGLPALWAATLVVALGSVGWQWASGRIWFGGDALMAALYLSAFGLAIALGAALAPLPAAWLLAALAILGLSLGDRWALLGWVLLAAFATVGIVGELLSLPDWVVGLSPFQHIAKVPSEPMAWGPAVVLTVLTAVVSAVAWWAYRRRDIG